MNLKKIVQISPLIGSFLIFLGFGRLWVYYGHWNISIVNYLNFSEIILSFLSNLNILIFFLILLLLQTTLGVALIVFMDKQANKPLHITQAFQTKETIPLSQQSHQNEIIEPINKKKQNRFRKIMDSINKGGSELEHGFKNHQFKVTLLLLCPVVLFLGLFLVFVKLIFLYFGFACFVQFLIIFIHKIIGIKDVKIVLLISSIITISCFTLCLTWNEIKQTELNPVKIELLGNNNQTFSSNKNIIFLGKTNDFYFFYDTSKSQSIMITSNTIQKATKGN